MELGEGIFLGLALIALVLLYVYTRDRWSWKKIVISCVALAVGLVASLVSYEWWDSRPTPRKKPEYVTSFLDLDVGASKGDVLFRKGEPDAKFIAADKPDELWAYRGGGNQTNSLRFKNELLVSISAENPCESPPPRECNNMSEYECDKARAGDYLFWIDYSVHLNYVHLCDSLDVLVARVGEPDSTFDMEGGLRRRYDYTKTYNVSYILERSRVISMTAGRP